MRSGWLQLAGATRMLGHVLTPLDGGWRDVARRLLLTLAVICFSALVARQQRRLRVPEAVAVCLQRRRAVVAARRALATERAARRREWLDANAMLIQHAWHRSLRYRTVRAHRVSDELHRRSIVDPALARAEAKWASAVASGWEEDLSPATGAALLARRLAAVRLKSETSRDSSVSMGPSSVASEPEPDWLQRADENLWSPQPTGKATPATARPAPSHLGELNDMLEHGLGSNSTYESWTRAGGRGGASPARARGTAPKPSSASVSAGAG